MQYFPGYSSSPVQVLVTVFFAGHRRDGAAMHVPVLFRRVAGSSFFADTAAKFAGTNLPVLKYAGRCCHIICRDDFGVKYAELVYYPGVVPMKPAKVVRKGKRGGVIFTTVHTKHDTTQNTVCSSRIARNNIGGLERKWSTQRNHKQRKAKLNVRAELPPLPHALAQILCTFGYSSLQAK